MFQQFWLIRSGGAHAVQSAFFGHGPLCAEEDVVLVIGSTSVVNGQADPSVAGDELVFEGVVGTKG